MKVKMSYFYSDFNFNYLAIRLDHFSYYNFCYKFTFINASIHMMNR